MPQRRINSVPSYSFITLKVSPPSISYSFVSFSVILLIISAFPQLRSFPSPFFYIASRPLSILPVFSALHPSLPSLLSSSLFPSFDIATYPSSLFPFVIYQLLHSCLPHFPFTLSFLQHFIHSVHPLSLSYPLSSFLRSPSLFSPPSYLSTLLSRESAPPPTEYIRMAASGRK